MNKQLALSLALILLISCIVLAQPVQFAPASPPSDPIGDPGAQAPMKGVGFLIVAGVAFGMYMIRKSKASRNNGA